MKKKKFILCIVHVCVRNLNVYIFVLLFIIYVVFLYFVTLTLLNFNNNVTDI